MVPALAALAAILTALPARAPRPASILPAVAPVALTGAWATVGLPAAPLGIAVHDGTIWVCGWDEMIAESADGGRDWTVRNLKAENGELLFSFAFFGKRRMAVFGSAGLWYRSTDGGETWKRRAYLPRNGLSEVVFADAKHGYGLNASQFAVTGDGGEYWTFRSLKAAPAGPMAVLDARRMAVVVSPEKAKADTILLTNDGGRHWRRLDFAAGQEWSGMLARPSGYAAYGTMLQGKRHVRDAATSSDGTTWLRGPAPAARFSDCTAQGCLADEGAAWAAAPSLQTLKAVPDDADHPTTGAWAADGATFCRVSATLRCRTGSALWHAGPAAPPPSLAGAQAARCERCGPPKYPPAARAALLQGSVTIKAEVGKDGRIHDPVVSAAPAEVLAAATLEALKTWRYHPLVIGGKTLAVSTQITVSFTLGP